MRLSEITVQTSFLADEELSSNACSVASFVAQFVATGLRSTTHCPLGRGVPR